jgi:hypothetical protein
MKNIPFKTAAPSSFQMGNDGVAWIDDSGRLMLFDRGKTYTRFL